MRRYTYSYVYDTCFSQWVGTSSTGLPIYIGNGRIKFFETEAADIIEADKKLAEFCELKKINWAVHPFTQVVCSLEELNA
jgi:hypothetical protein